MFGGMVLQGMSRVAMSEWQKLPPDQVTCIDENLRRQNTSVTLLVMQGVVPSAPWLGQIRVKCANQDVRAQQPETPQVPAAYAVDGLALGAKVRFDSKAYAEYRCGLSEKFEGLVWCHKEQTKRANRRSVELSESILHRSDGTVLYVNRYIEPASFSPTDVQDEINRLSIRYGQSPRIVHLDSRPGLPNAVIAVWGATTLSKLTAEDAAVVASGGRQEGLLLSFLGGLQRSAKAGVPVYRLDGGPGFVWAASFDNRRRGTLRFLAVDASAIGAAEKEFEANLAKQQAALQSLVARLSDLTRRSSGQAIAKFVAPDTVAELNKLNSESSALASRSSKSDLSIEIDALNKKITEVDNSIKAAETAANQLSDDLSDLNNRAKDISQRLSQDGIRAFASQETLNTAEASVKEVSDLRSENMPDAKSEQEKLRILRDKLVGVEKDLADAASKYTKAKNLDARRESLSQRIATVTAYFEQPEIRQWASESTRVTLEQLTTQNRQLLKLSGQALNARGDYAELLSAAEATLSNVEPIKRQMVQVLQLAESVNTLREKIADRHGDTGSAKLSAEFSEINGVYLAIKHNGVPFSADQIASAQAGADTILRKLGDSIMVPLEKYGGTYVVPVLVNKAIPLKFVVDSGASDVVLPKDVVMTLVRTGTLGEGDFIGEQRYALADGTILPSMKFTIKSLTIGNQVIENVTAAVAPIEGSLLLGQSFLRKFKSWSIDNARNALVLNR